jgi:hypothetical protein
MGYRRPEQRAASIDRHRTRIRRQYRKDVSRGRRVRLGEQEHVVNLVVIFTIAGYNPTQIAQTLGITRGKVKFYLDQPETVELMDRILTGLTAAARSLLESYSIEAVQTIADVMRSSDDDKMILQAASEILDRSGLPKASRTEKKVHQTREELTTITDDGIVDQLREASPELQEKAAVLVEQLEGLLAQAAGETEEVDEPTDD